MLFIKFVFCSKFIDISSDEEESSITEYNNRALTSCYKESKPTLMCEATSQLQTNDGVLQMIQDLPKIKNAPKYVKHDCQSFRIDLMDQERILNKIILLVESKRKQHFSFNFTTSRDQTPEEKIIYNRNFEIIVNWNKKLLNCKTVLENV